MTPDEAFYQAAERRVGFLTLGLGACASLVLLATRGWRIGAGVLLGTTLGWINLCWLKQGINVFARLAAAQAEAPAVRIPKRTYFKFFGRYALLIAALYVIFSYSWLPAGAVIGGLFFPVGAVVLEVVYQILGVGRSGGAGAA